MGIAEDMKKEALGRTAPYADDYSANKVEDFGLPKTEGNLQNSYFGDNVSNIDLDSGLGSSSSSFLDKAFSGDNIGSSLGGIGIITKGVGSIWDAYNKKEYQDEMVSMEKARVAREVDKQTKAQAALDKAWA